MARIYEEDDYEEDYLEEGFDTEEIEDDDLIADILYEIVTRMGFKDVDIEWEERSDHTRYFVEGGDMGVLIGSHGITLEALQYLVGVINSRKGLVKHKIIVDIGGYRERRERVLRVRARKEAENAVRYGEEITLEPMPACDRRIIHVCLHNNPAVETYSEGEEPERFVVIKPV